MQVKTLLEGGTGTLAPPALNPTGTTGQTYPSRVGRGAADMRKSLSPSHIRRASNALTDRRRRSGIGGSRGAIDQVLHLAHGCCRQAVGEGSRRLISSSGWMAETPPRLDVGAPFTGISTEVPRRFRPGNVKPVRLVLLEAWLELGSKVP